jgi:hypothetical protein
MWGKRFWSQFWPLSSTAVAVASATVFVMFVGFALVWANLSADSVASAIIQTFVFLATTYISWIISRHFAKEQKEAESRRLGLVAGRRVIELYKNVQSLLSKTLVYRDPNSLSQERFVHIANRLEEISLSIRSTLADVKSIAEIGIDDDEELGIPAEHDIHGLSNFVACPYCHAKNYVSTPNHSGATQEMSCIECKEFFITHRHQDRSVFARPRIRKKTALSTASAGDAPLGSIVHIKRDVPAAGPTSVSHLKLNCPKCSVENEYGYRKGFTYLKRSCFECFTRFKYNFEPPTFELLESRDPEVLHEAFEGPFYAYINCTECTQKVRTDRPTLNSKRQQVVQCFRCGTGHISEIRPHNTG